MPLADGRIRWGILGTGRMAGIMANELRGLAHQGAELVAIGSRSAASAKEFAQKFDIPRSHASHEALAADSDIDVVYIATPPSAHASNLHACLESGKAVLCEKPFTLNAEEARAAIGIARSRNVFLMEAMWTRFLPAVAALREHLQTDAIGEIQLLIGGGAFVPPYTPGYYLFSTELGGGVLLDAGIYLISMSSMCLGKPERALSSVDMGSYGVDDHAAMILEHSSGAKSILYVSLRAKRSPDLEILGSKGRIHVGAPVFRPTQLTLVSGAEQARPQEYPIEGTGYGLQALEVMAALREGRTESTVMPLIETLSIMQTMDEVRHARMEGAKARVR
jgi:predicted dehydrogenase